MDKNITVSNLSNDIENKFRDILKCKAINFNIKFIFLNDLNQRSLIKIRKLNRIYSFITKSDLLVTVNENIYDAMDENTINILFEQEIDKITIDVEKGVIKIIKPEINTFAGIVLKYGYDVVANANILNEQIIKNLFNEKSTLN